jgi:CHAD domain-containing protein
MTLLAMPVVVGQSELLGAHLKRFNRTLRGLERGDTRMLHAARVASRRLRELVPILQLDAATARKLSRRLRKVTKRLGGVRELDVLLQLIDELHETRREHSDPLSRLAVTVAKARDEAREQLAEDLPVRDMRRLAKRLDRASAELQARHEKVTPVRRSQQWRWAIDARVVHRAQQLESAIRDAGAVYLPERLHVVRITIKKLRYALELSLEAAGRRAAHQLRNLTRQQDTLGRMHDLQTLIERIRQLQATLAPPSVTVWRGLDRLVSLLDEDCRRLHARYMRGRPALEALASRLEAVSAAAAARPRSSRRAS